MSGIKMKTYSDVLTDFLLGCPLGIPASRCLDCARPATCHWLSRVTQAHGTLCSPRIQVVALYLCQRFGCVVSPVLFTAGCLTMPLDAHDPLPHRAASGRPALLASLWLSQRHAAPERTDVMIETLRTDRMHLSLSSLSVKGGQDFRKISVSGTMVP